MKEYTIYLRHGNCKPYTLGTYKTIEDAKIKLYDIIQLEIERKRPFFVDNDFFDNKFNLGSDLFYMCILERNITEWERCFETNSISKNNDKILYLYKI